MRNLNLKSKIIIFLAIIASYIVFLQLIKHYQRIQSNASINFISHTKSELSSVTNKKNASASDSSVVLTKDALDELIKKAAEQKYLQDVLNSGPTLPLSKLRAKPIELQPNLNKAPVSTSFTSQIKSSPQIATLIKNNGDNQHCLYQGQTYSLGEIVQIDKGWIRCTPSIMFAADNSSQYGSAVWTLRDSLL